MYYLKTRYYNPNWCRFISSDNITYLEYDNPLNISLFRYCANNPVMNVDPDGKFNWKRFWGISAEIAADVISIIAGVAAGIATVFVGFFCIANAKNECEEYETSKIYRAIGGFCEFFY